jgi:uncharacterized protein (DUF885 family)
LESAVPQATDDAGLSRFAKGSDVYNYQLRRYTTTKMTPEEIHQVGLKMVAEIQGQMDALRARLASEPLPRFPATEQGLAAYKADIDETIRDAERRAMILFDRLPKARVVAQPYPSFFGRRAASYVQPAPDGSRPGTFQYTTPGLPSPGSQGLFKFSHSTIFHETVPGHHFQIGLQIEDTSLPRFRRDRIFGSNSAFVEGWGLYAERLAAESGWYEGDLWGQLDQLSSERFRARRLVIDTGLHAKRWTRQQGY